MPESLTQQPWLLADECVFHYLIEDLRTLGHPIATPQDFHIAGASDLDLLIHAQRRKLVILTFDKDFSHIKRLKVGRQTGIIWIKNIRVSRKLLTHIIHQLLLSRPPIKFLGRLTIVEPHRVRSLLL